MCAQNIRTTGIAPEQCAISVIVPVYNNAGSLPLLHERLVSILATVTPAYEIIYVNDGSSDSSYDVLVGLRANGGRVRIIDLVRNFGQSAAVLAGFENAAGDILVTIDADLENHPEDIPVLVREVVDGADLVCGIRGSRQAPLVSRKGPSWVANRLVSRALRIDLQDWGCGLNAVTSEMARQMLAQDPLPRLPKIEAALLSSQVFQVPVAHSDREHGDSGYTVRRLLGFAAAFLSDYSVTRTFRRLRGVTEGRSNARTGPGIINIASWFVLSSASIIVRFVLLMFGSKSKAERFQVREVLE